MLAFSVGAPEILIIVLIVLLLFGSTQIPKLARSLGKAQKEFKDGLSEGFTDEDEEKAEKGKKKGS